MSLYFKMPSKIKNYFLLAIVLCTALLLSGCLELQKTQNNAPHSYVKPSPIITPRTPTPIETQKTPTPNPVPSIQKQDNQFGLETCSSEQECMAYCEEHEEECHQYCIQHPESKPCIEMGKAHGFEDENVEIPGKCSGWRECGAFCSMNPESCDEFCAVNTASPLCQGGPGQGEPLGNPPVLKISTMFIDLNKIKMISKFRSCQGHLVVPGTGDEPRSTMKHYFKVKPEFVGTNDKVAVYAPFKGYIFDIALDRCRRPTGPCYGGGEIGLLPIESLDKFRPEDTWSFSVIHIKPLPNLKVNDIVEEGQLIGFGDFVGGDESYNTVDIVISKHATQPVIIDGYSSPYSALDSLFNYLDENVWNEFKAHGIKSKEELFFSKEYRQTHECRYEGSGPYFWSGYQNDPSEWIELT